MKKIRVVVIVGWGMAGTAAMVSMAIREQFLDLGFYGLIWIVLMLSLWGELDG